MKFALSFTLGTSTQKLILFPYQIFYNNKMRIGSINSIYRKNYKTMLS